MTKKTTKTWSETEDVCRERGKHGICVAGVRVDRVRGGRQTYKRRAEPGVSLYPPGLFPLPHAVCNSESCRFFSAKLPVLSLFNFLCHIMVRVLGNKVISHLLLTEPAPLAANQDDSTNDSSLRTLLTLCDLLNRQLLLLIGWAKQIPGRSWPERHCCRHRPTTHLSDTRSAPPPQASPASHWSTRCRCCRAAGWRCC